MSWLSGVRLVTIVFKLRKLHKMLETSSSPREVAEKLLGSDAPEEAKKMVAKMIELGLKAKNGEISVTDAVKEISSMLGMKSSELIELASEVIEAIAEMSSEKKSSTEKSSRVSVP